VAAEQAVWTETASAAGFAARFADALARQAARPWHEENRRHLATRGLDSTRAAGPAEVNAAAGGWLRQIEANGQSRVFFLFFLF